jgi:hypothetical protein
VAERHILQTASPSIETIEKLAEQQSTSRSRKRSVAEIAAADAEQQLDDRGRVWSRGGVGHVEQERQARRRTRIDVPLAADRRYRIAMVAVSRMPNSVSWMPKD